MLKILAPLVAVTVTAAGLLSPALASHSQASVSLTGAGSTFDYPFFDKAFSVYQGKTGVSVNYQSIGSGAGIQLFTAKTVDFGASDVPMNPVTELPAAIKAGGPVEQIPITIGGESIAYNIPGVKSGLRLTGDVLANIFLGTITKWNDKAIKKLNPKAKLPNLPIVVVHRSDSSGTSYIFTDYLSKISDQWRGLVGTSKTPNWPVGLGGKGNPGVAAIVQQQPGAIGYVELAYVLQNHMTEAKLQNRSHQYVYPTPATVKAAASKFPHVSAQHFSIVDAAGKNAYPIAGYSWVLVYRNYSDTTKGQAVAKLMSWMVTSGQTYATKLDYVPLPKSVTKSATTMLKLVK